MKIIRRVLKWTSFGILGLLLVVFLLLLLDQDYHEVALSEADKASIKPQKVFALEADSSRYDSLFEAYGKNKTLAKGFELQCLLALSHYPELKEVPIEFQVKPSFLPLASRPDPITILFPWLKRKYLVVISNESTDFFEPILLENTPFNEQVGIIGHELAHTVYYLDKSALQIAGIAYRYEFNDLYHDNFERDTDKRAIAHGLGYQMYDFAFFVRRAFGQSEEAIRQDEGGTYLSPKEIAVEMGKYEFYNELPCPRNQPVVAYHVKQKAIFLFGGFCHDEKKRFNDLWKFDGIKWILVETKEPPPPRSGHAMVYDSLMDRLLVFGGKDDSGNLLNDLWSWDGKKWTLIAREGPPPRQSHRMLVDTDNGNIYLFGGSDEDRKSYADTWLFKNAKWTMISGGNTPPARLQHTMAYDPERKKVVLFGGFDRTKNGKVVYGDTWEWDVANGWQLKAQNEALARDHHAMAYDPNLKKVILFGGYNQGYFGDTRYWDGQKWSLLREDGPTPRAGKPGLLYSDVDKSLVLFGGWDQDSKKPLMDFWQFHQKDTLWGVHPFSDSK